jgi:hypothetical protein
MRKLETVVLIMDSREKTSLAEMDSTLKFKGLSITKARGGYLHPEDDLLAKLNSNSLKEVLSLNQRLVGLETFKGELQNVVNKYRLFQFICTGIRSVQKIAIVLC